MNILFSDITILNNSYVCRNSFCYVLKASSVKKEYIGNMKRLNIKAVTTTIPEVAAPDCTGDARPVKSNFSNQ